MDFVPFLNPCMLIQTIGEKKLVYYQNLIKESKAELCDGGFFQFPLP